MNQFAGRRVHRSDIEGGDFIEGGEWSSAGAIESRVAQTLEYWVDVARDSARRADDFIRESPWQCIGMAAACGFAAGFLAYRRQ